MVTKVQTSVTTDAKVHVKGGEPDFIRFVLDHSSSAVLRIQNQK